MTPQRSTAEILKAAKDTLTTALLGLKDVQANDPVRRMAGLRNLIVFGRAVTNVLQNLRATEPAFDAWYAPFVQEMSVDPLLKFLYDTRTAILKQGSLQTSTSIHIADFHVGRDRHLWGDPPANATDMFLGDRIGGAGWHVTLPDGSVETYYVSLPETVMKASIHLPAAPLRHLGNDLPDNSIATLGGAYAEYLRHLVDEAQKQFQRPLGGA